MSHVDTRPIWNRLADFWDKALGEGNDFQKHLIMPATDRLLNARLGEVVLDVCCGNGNYARLLAARGVKVVACDGSNVFIDRARARTSGDMSIEYHVTDATSELELLSLGVGRFDAVVISMAVMDLPTIDPVFKAARQLLGPGGRVVFSVSHPCFNSNRPVITADLVEGDDGLRQRFGVQIFDYAQPMEYLSAGILNQPEPHPFFHRPLHVLLASCFAAGFVVDGIEEPTFPPDFPSRNPFSWAKRPNLPPAIVVRLR